MNWDDTTDETTAPERLVAASADGEDQAVEAALRPKDLGEFIGQEKVREQLDLVLRAARARGATADHVLLSGAPGLGKTTLSMIIAAEMEAPIRITSGPAIQHAGDLAAILSSLQEGEVLFLDEIHRMSRPAEEMLYMAMEDFRVDVIVGKGPGATAIPLELPPFTLVGATTRAGLLPPRCATASASPRTWSSTNRPSCSASSTAPRTSSTWRSAPRAPPRSPAARAAPPYRQPSAAPRPGLRAGEGRRHHHARHRPGRPEGLRGRRPRSRPPGPRCPRSAAQAVRRRTGRALHAGRRGGGGAGNRRGGRRALPRTGGTTGPYPARTSRDARRMGASRPHTAAFHNGGSGQQDLFGA